MEGYTENGAGTDVTDQIGFAGMRRKKKQRRGLSVFQLKVIGAVALVLIFQRHMSAVMLVGIMGVSMMFISGMPKKTFWKFIGVCAVFGVLLLIYKMASGSGFSYISDRIQSWKNPESDPSGKTFQTYESLLSIGSGGWFGLGFGESRQKYYLPESQNDFVFAIICEELGFVGAMVVVLLFVLSLQMFNHLIMTKQMTTTTQIPTAVVFFCLPMGFFMGIIHYLYSIETMIKDIMHRKEEIEA